MSIQRLLRADVTPPDPGPPADAAPPAAPPPADPTSAATERVAVRKKIDDALNQLAQLDLSYLTEDQYNRVAYFKAVLKSEAAAIDGYGLGGGAGPGGAGPGATPSNLVDMPAGLVDGWNGNYVMTNIADHQTYIENNAAKYGTYNGSVGIINSGATDLTRIGFSLSDDMTRVDMESHGRDLILTATYNDGRKGSWVIRDGTVLPDPIIVSATNLTHGVTIDASHALRVSDGNYGVAAGTRAKIYIHGTKFDDTIYGAQSDSVLVGWAGNDTLIGGAGKDTLYGDEGSPTGAFDPNYGGNDTISGGGNTDTLYGGGGWDVRSRSDNPTTDNPESVQQFEGVSEDVAGSIPANQAWFHSDDWAIDSSENGMVTVTNTTGHGGTIDLSMGEMNGYTMAFGEAQADGSLIVTFVGKNESDNQQTFKVKFKDFMNFSGNAGPQSDVPTLNINGTDGDDIIDMSRVTLDNQVINYNGWGGNDFILGAQNALLRDGVDINNLELSQGNSSAQLDQIATSLLTVPTPTAGHTADVPAFRTRVSGRVIEIDRNPDAPADNHDPLNLAVPQGYDHAYRMEDGSGGYYLILVKPGETADTIVVHVAAGLGLGPQDMIAGQAPANNTDAPRALHFVSLSRDLLNDAGYQMTGGEGNDVIFVQHGSNTNPGGAQGDDTIVEWTNDAESGLGHTPATDPGAGGGGGGGH